MFSMSHEGAHQTDLSEVFPLEMKQLVFVGRDIYMCIYIDMYIYANMRAVKTNLMGPR